MKTIKPLKSACTYSSLLKTGFGCCFVSFTKMFVVKTENRQILCQGCLSLDRQLSPLKNHDIYFSLLGNKYAAEEYKYVDILLCWECHALLRRFQVFRCKLQRAQYTISVARTEWISPETLSTLKYQYKQDYDLSIEESIESKLAEPLIDNTDIDIKEEIQDNFEADNFETDNFELSQNDNHKRKGTKCKKEKKEFKKVECGLDFSDPNKFFSQSCLSEKEVDEILGREREADVCRPAVCETCGFRFLNKTEVYNHRKIAHRKRVTTGHCTQCAFPYKTVWDLELHCWRSHPVNRCVLCMRVVAHERDRARHLEMHRYRYRCLKCGADFDHKRLCQLHEKQLHSKYECDHCGHTSHTKKAMEKHVLRHHLPNKCPSCALTFPTWERLRRHARDAHVATGPAYCVECDRTFITTAKYNRHLSQSQKHRPKERISVPCPECGKVFSRKNYMNNHMKLFHLNQSRHHCALCDKYFVSGFSLRSHNKYVHEKIPMPKTKICSVCGRGFGTNRVLENHMRTHTGERPFACALCPAAFAQRVALKAHRAAIHKEKG